MKRHSLTREEERKRKSKRERGNRERRNGSLGRKERATSAGTDTTGGLTTERNEEDLDKYGKKILYVFAEK